MTRLERATLAISIIAVVLFGAVTLVLAFCTPWWANLAWWATCLVVSVERDGK